jgi:hypothetical protein
MGRPGLTRHRKFRRLARELRSEAIARGCLELLWDSSYESGDEYLGDGADVEAAARWDGEAGKLTQALLLAGGDGHAGFIEEVSGHPGHYCVHDLFENAPDYVQKRRERELDRKQRGVTLSEVRSAAARKSHEARAQITAKDASVLQTAANGGHMQTPALGTMQTAANGVTPAPAPAPTPAPKENPLSEHFCSDEENPSPQGSKQPSQEACRLAALLKSEIHRNKGDFRITPAQERSWAVTAQRMIDRDEREPREIEKLIRWAQRDEFWLANILSMEKLRKQFGQLQMKCGRQGVESPHTGFEQRDYKAGLQTNGDGTYRL